MCKVTNLKLVDKTLFSLWHKRFGHPGEPMIWRIIKSSHGHPPKNQKILWKGDLTWTTCLLGNIITSPLITKVNAQNLLRSLK